MGWKTGLPHCWPYDNSRSLMSHSPGHNRLLSEGKGARTSICKSAGPITLQVWPSKRFPHKGYPHRWWLWPSTIHHVGPWGTKTTIDIGGTKGLCHLSSCHLPWTEGLRVTGVHYWWLHPCHPGLIDQTDPGIPDEGDSTERTELTWR